MTPTKEPEVVAATPPKIVQFRDHVIDYPELFASVYISEPVEEQAFAAMLARSWCTRAEKPEDADLVIFTGGEDVNPTLYGEDLKTIHTMTRFHKPRDDRDMVLYADCFLAGIPMVGVCRGAQFLHVMNGGRLYQHVDEHVGDHPMEDVSSGITISKISSTHHQMVIPNNKMKVLGVAKNRSKNRWFRRGDKEDGPNSDVEAFFYPDTCCLGFQGHPEYFNYATYTVWCLKQIEQLIFHNPHVTSDTVNKKYRLKRELILERENIDDDEKDGNLIR